MFAAASLGSGYLFLLCFLMTTVLFGNQEANTLLPIMHRASASSADIR